MYAIIDFSRNGKKQYYKCATVELLTYYMEELWIAEINFEVTFIK